MKIIKLEKYAIEDKNYKSDPFYNYRHSLSDIITRKLLYTIYKPIIDILIPQANNIKGCLKDNNETY